MNAKIKNNAEILWDYHLLHHELPKEVDVIVGLGHIDMAVAQRAIELYRSGLSGRILFTGGNGLYTRDLPKPEAEIFADYAAEQGVPRKSILIENRSRNTGENIRFSQSLTRELGVRSLTLVTVPYHERRTNATFEAQWTNPQNVDATVTSLRIDGRPQSFMDFSEHYRMEPDALLTLVANATQKIIDYPKQGFISPQPMDEEVLEALRSVQEQGYSSAIPSRSALDAFPLSA